MSKSPNDFFPKIRQLHQWYHDGTIPRLAHHERHPDLPKSSRENYLYFTLAPALNFQRSSPALWLAAFNTYQDPQTKYLFFPEQLTVIPREQIQTDLGKHRLALQPNKHTDIWMTISRTLHQHFNNDPRQLLAAGEWNIIQTRDLIRGKYATGFPYLRGPKLTDYWLYILHEFTDAPFINPEEITIIPDTHIIRSTVHLGLLESTAATPQTVAQLWKDLLAGSSLTPIDLHPVLWNWSRNNFLPTVY